MTLSVLIAAYNERETIDEILHRVLEEDIVHEVIVVDDGSTDGTRELLSAWVGIDERIKVICQDSNQGKGACIRRALTHATGRITIIQDADLEYFPSDYEAVIQPIVKGESKVVYGSRVLCADNVYPLDLFRVGSFVVTQTANLLYDTRLTDEPTCYKAFDTQFLRSLPLSATGFELCPEVTAWTRKCGETIIEVPIQYSKRTVAEGKKIRWQDGVLAIWTLLQLRFK
jgi:dolichol-phosphate mannosyltransferase